MAATANLWRPADELGAQSGQHLDGRPPIAQLYRSLECLAGTTGTHVDELWVQHAALPHGGEAHLSILSLRSAATGPALWVLAGIHGEEPAGPVAVAQHIDLFMRLVEMGVPWVLFPLCNPKGYLLDWRYPDARRQESGAGHSVGDCTHLLPSAEDPGQPRRSEGPACPEAAALSEQILALVGRYPPLLTLDLHEDELANPNEGYVYSQGELAARDPVALESVSILERYGFAPPPAGVTRFGEPIRGGVVAPIADGSIDEMLACRTLVRDGRVVPGPAARTVIVIETPAGAAPLARRVAAQAEILHALPRRYAAAQLGRP